MADQNDAGKDITKPLKPLKLKTDRARQIWTLIGSIGGGILLAIMLWVVFGSLPGPKQINKALNGPAQSTATPVKTSAPDPDPAKMTDEVDTIDLAACRPENIVLEDSRVTFRNCVR